LRFKRVRCYDFKDCEIDYKTGKISITVTNTTVRCCLKYMNPLNDFRCCIFINPNNNIGGVLLKKEYYFKTR